MTRIIDVKYNKSGFMVVLLGIFGFGSTIITEEKETSTTVNFKIWKLHVFFSFAWI